MGWSSSEKSFSRRFDSSYSSFVTSCERASGISRYPFVSQNSSCSLVRPDDRSLAGGGGETLEGAMSGAMRKGFPGQDVYIGLKSVPDGRFCLEDATWDRYRRSSSSGLSSHELRYVDPTCSLHTLSGRTDLAGRLHERVHMYQENLGSGQREKIGRVLLTHGLTGFQK